LIAIRLFNAYFLARTHATVRLDQITVITVGNFILEATLDIHATCPERERTLFTLTVLTIERRGGGANILFGPA
jgi:hypothetical protein